MGEARSPRPRSSKFIPWLTIGSFAALLVHHGFAHEGATNFGTGALMLATLLVTARDWRWRCGCDGSRRDLELLMLGSGSVFTVITLWVPSPGVELLAHASVFVIIGMNLARWVSGGLTRAPFRIGPAGLFLCSYVVLAAIGACVLALPSMTHGDGSLPLGAALFTSISANCVTGLVVVETGSTFTTAGLVSLAVMIQLGGINVIAFATFYLLYDRAPADPAARAVTEEFLHLDLRQDVRSVVARAALVCLTIEVVGAAALSAAGLSWFDAVFHAISAFNNAGFSPYADSLESAPRAIKAIIGLLIVAGALGVPILIASARWMARRGALGVDAAIGLPGSVFLLLAGWLALSWFDPSGAALFHSVSARTAGFSASSLTMTGTGARLVLVLLMFVGACSASTGGGIKVSTAAVAVGSLVRPLRRRIRPGELRRARAIVLLGLGTVALSTIGLLLVVPDLPFVDALFEASSAFGTVGLSTADTRTLGGVGQSIVAVTILVGRVGPLALAMATGRLVETAKPRMMLG